MKRLHLYMIKSFIGPFTMTVILAMIVLILQFVWKWIDELAGKGLSWKVVTELLFYVSVSLGPRALILGVLLSSIMLFGTLGEHSEISALKSSGISLFKIMLPVLILVIALGTGAFFFSNDIVPQANLRFFTLLFDIRHKRPAFDIREGQFYNGIEGYSLKIGSRSRDGKMLYHLMLYDQTAKAGNVAITIADSGHMVITKDNKNMLMTLYHGQSYEEQLGDNNRIQKNKPLRRDRFEMQQFLFKLPGSDFKRTDQDLYKDNYLMQNMRGLTKDIKGLTKERYNKLHQTALSIISSQIFRYEDKKKEKTPLTAWQDNLTHQRINYDSLFETYTLYQKQRTVNYALNLARTTQSTLKSAADEYQIRSRWIHWHEVEWHRKITLSLACLIFFLIGAPLGAIIRKGGLGTPVVISVVFFIFYYVITLAGEKYAKAGVLPVWLGMWGSSFILLIAGIYLTIKSTRDSTILKTETYFRVIRKVLRLNGKGKTPGEI